MSLAIYESNRLENLSELFCKKLSENLPEDPMTGILVVIPNSAIGTWLKQEIAKIANLGIAMNISTCYPGKFFYRWVFDQVDALKERTNDSVSEKDRVDFDADTLHILAIKELRECIEDSDFAPIRDYIQSRKLADSSKTGGFSSTSDDLSETVSRGIEDNSIEEMRIYQLSARIARLFDRYMTYRPDILKNWEENRESSDSAERWQAKLWRKIISVNPSARIYSRAFWEFMEHPNPAFVLNKLRNTFNSIYYFGLSATPPPHLAMMQKISEFIDSHFFWMNPCESYWGENEPLKSVEKYVGKKMLARCADEKLLSEMEKLVIESAGNQILSSCGKIGRELHKLLLDCQIESVEKDFIHNKNEYLSLLHALQNDILENKISVINEKKTDFDSNEKSLTIHNCFSPLREVETFYDFLLKEFNSNESLLPGDIMVYVSDMEKYASAIESVFGGITEDSEKAIPFTIADRNLVEEFPLCRAFLEITKVFGGRFKASEILPLLNFECIRQKAGISEEEQEEISALFCEAGARWGIDEIFREQACGSYGFHENSLRFAMERLILGAVMMEEKCDASNPIERVFQRPSDKKDTVCIAIAPVENIESVTSCIGKLCEWLERLFAVQSEISQKQVRPFSEWVEFARTRILENLIADNNDDGIIELNKTFETLFMRFQDANALDMLTGWNLFRDILIDNIGSGVGRERFCTGKVTFCKFQSSRALPAKIVGMLGMNDGDFPVLDKTLGFDLMAGPNKKRLCDRWNRDDDRYAFLEALLSAREKLFISYTGRRDTDKQEMPPSILVSELLEYIDSRYEPINNSKGKEGANLVSSQIIFNESLHPFSPDCFDSSKPNMQSCSDVWFAVAKKIYQKDNEKDNDARKVHAETGSNLSDINSSAPTLLRGKESEEPLRITVPELVKFFESPCKFYYKNILGANFDLESEDMPEDCEPAKVDNLEGYNLKNRIYEIRNRLTKEEWDASKDSLFRKFSERVHAEGKLPPNPAGKFLLEKIWEETIKRIEFFEEQERQAGEKLPPEKGDLQFNVDGKNILLVYSIDDIRENFRLIPRFGKTSSFKNELSVAIETAILKYLMNCLQKRLPDKARIIAMEECKEIYFEELDPFKYLEEILSIYVKGHKKPLFFWYSCAEEGLKTSNKNTEIPLGFDIKKAISKWNPSQYGASDYDRPDIYTKRIYGECLPQRFSSNPAMISNFKDLEEFARALFQYQYKSAKPAKKD